MQPHHAAEISATLIIAILLRVVRQHRDVLPCTVAGKPRPSRSIAHTPACCCPIQQAIAEPSHLRYVRWPSDHQSRHAAVYLRRTSRVADNQQVPRAPWCCGNAMHSAPVHKRTAQTGAHAHHRPSTRRSLLHALEGTDSRGIVLWPTTQQCFVGVRCSPHTQLPGEPPLPLFPFRLSARATSSSTPSTLCC